MLITEIKTKIKHTVALRPVFAKLSGSSEILMQYNKMLRWLDETLNAQDYTWSEIKGLRGIWVANNVIAVDDRLEKIPFYLTFTNEEDYLAFKLTFGA